MSGRLWSAPEAPGDPGDHGRPAGAPPPAHHVAAHALSSASAARLFCHACGRQLDPRAVLCPSCGVPQQQVAMGVGLRPPPATKSEGVAVALSFLWPGAGHLYAEDTSAKAITFTVISGVCLLLSLTIIGLVLSVPAWLGCAIYTMIDAPNAVRAHHRRVQEP